MDKNAISSITTEEYKEWENHSITKCLFNSLDEEIEKRRTRYSDILKLSTSMEDIAHAVLHTEGFIKGLDYFRTNFINLLEDMRLRESLVEEEKKQKKKKIWG